MALLCLLTATFSPASVGLKAAALSIAHSASGSPSTVALTRTGKQASAQPAPVDYEKDIQPIFNASCAVAGCHVPGGSGPISLVAGVSYANLLSPAAPIQPWVVPKDLARSMLVQSVDGSFLPRMPLERDPLSQDQIDLIKRWITEGALPKAAPSQPPPSGQPLDPAPVARFTIKPDAIKAGDTKGVVTLDASASSDPDGDSITYKWSVSGATFKKSTSDTSRVAQVTFADTIRSNVTIALTVADKSGLKATLTQILRVLVPPPAAASVVVDLDPANDNQNANLQYGVKGGDPITLQIFLKDVSGVTGYTVKVKYDTIRIGSPSYANGPLVAGNIALPSKVAGGVVEGGASTPPPTPSSGSGLLATFTFKAKDSFEGSATFSVTSVSLQMGTTRKELITAELDVEVSADKTGMAGPASDFSGDGTVGFDDFFTFALAFNTKKGDPGFNPIFDLNGDGMVGFEDFFIFAGEFGQTSGKPAVRR